MAHLARAEAKRMLKSPVLWFTVVLAGLVMWMEHAGMAPVLNTASATTSLPLLLIGGGGLLVACESAMRMWRTEGSEAIDITPSSNSARTTAMLLAAITPVALAVFVQTAAVVGLMFDRPVTSLIFSELLTGPVVVVLMVALGVAAGRWFPSRFTGPLTLVAAVSVTLILSMSFLRQQFGEVSSWFGIYVRLDTNIEGVFRPAFPHLIYLLGITGVLAALALARSWAANRLTPVALATVGGLLIAVGAIGQVSAYDNYDRETALDPLLPPQVEYVCETHSSVEYCVLPGYEAWIAEWEALVQPVLDLAPSEAVAPLLVRQYPGGLLDEMLGWRRPDLAGNHLATGVLWGRGPGVRPSGESFPYGMALGAASWTVALPTELVRVVEVEIIAPEGYSIEVPTTDIEGHPEEDTFLQFCTTVNQGRAVVALWMAAQASEEAKEYFLNEVGPMEYPIVDDGTVMVWQRWMESFGNGQFHPWWPLNFQIHEAFYAKELLSQPAEEVRGILLANWEELVDPSTTTMRAVEIFGLRAIPGHDEFLSDLQNWYTYPPCT